MDIELAELVGVFIGDGCLSRYFSNYDNRWKSVVLFTGNLENDEEYYERVLRPIVMKNFNVKGYIYFRKSDSTIKYSIFCKKMISYFLKTGFKFGPKYNSCTVPAFINNIEDMLRRNGFKANRITKSGDYSLIRITNQEHVERFFKEIATNHPYHTERYENITNN